MHALGNGHILPGIGIGIIHIGMSYEEIRAVSTDFDIDERVDTFVLVGSNIEIWINKASDRVTQIMVKGGFAGRYAGAIGIGSTLAGVLALGKTYHEELNVYVLDDAPGMCLELGDTPDDVEWDELTAPIEYISVYAV